MEGKLAALALFAASVLALGGAGGAGSAGRVVSGLPDHYVTDWDELTTTAFAASGLSVADGVILFAYDIRRGLRLGDGRGRRLSPVRDRRRRAGAAPRRRQRPSRPRTPFWPTTCRRLAPWASCDPAYDDVAGGHSRRPGEGRRCRDGRFASLTLWIARRADDRLPRAGSRTRRRIRRSPACGCRLRPRRRLLPAPTSRLMRAVHLRFGLRLHGRPVRPSCRARSGRATTTRSRSSARARARPGRPSRPLAARFWAEAPVQQSHDAYRQFVLGRALDIVDASRLMAMVFVTFADAADRVLRREVPLRVLAADHRDPGGRYRRERRHGRRFLVVAAARATPNHPEYPSAHSCITPAGGRVDRPVPGHRADRLHRPQPDRSSRPALRQRPRPRGTRSATPASGAASTTAQSVEDGLEIAAQVAHHVLAHNFQRSND